MGFIMAIFYVYIMYCGPKHLLLASPISSILQILMISFPFPGSPYTLMTQWISLGLPVGAWGKWLFIGIWLP